MAAHVLALLLAMMFEPVFLNIFFLNHFLSS
jgi:hypothetical protein